MAQIKSNFQARVFERLGRDGIALRQRVQEPPRYGSKRETKPNKH